MSLKCLYIFLGEAQKVPAGAHSFRSGGAWSGVTEEWFRYPEHPKVQSNKILIHDVFQSKGPVEKRVKKGRGSRRAVDSFHLRGPFIFVEEATKHVIGWRT